MDLADHGKSWVYPSLKAGLASVMTLNFVNAVRIELDEQTLPSLPAY